MLGSNPGQLRLRHWLSDARATRLDLIPTRLHPIPSRLHLIPEKMNICWEDEHGHFFWRADITSKRVAKKTYLNKKYFFELYLGLGREFRSEKIPRYSLRTVFRFSAEESVHSEARVLGKGQFRRLERNRMEFRGQNKFYKTSEN